MRALQALAHTGVSALRVVRSVDTPFQTSSELLVRVHAVGLNAYDWARVHGYGERILSRLSSVLAPADSAAVRLPLTVGREGSGVVLEPDAAGTFRVGDRVAWALPVSADGCASELAAVPADCATLVPPSLSLATAAALPYAGLTALEALCEVGRLRPGDGVFIHGLAGSVGRLAMGLARRGGAAVVGGTCAASRRDELRAAGADVVVDYAEPGAWQAALAAVEPPTRWLVLDASGVAANTDASLEWLAGAARHAAAPPAAAPNSAHARRHSLVTLNGSLLRHTDEFGLLAGGALSAVDLIEQKVRARARGVSYDWALFHPDNELLAELLAECAAGRLAELPVASFALDDGIAAMSALQPKLAGSRAKVLVVMRPEP